MHVDLAPVLAASLLLAACGGGPADPAREEPVATAGGAAVSDEETPAEEGEGGLAICADPEGGGFYLYLGADAMVLTRTDGTRERLGVEALEETARDVARHEILPRDPGATVHVVTDDYTDVEARDRLLELLHEEGLAGADHCAPGATSPFPAVADALHAE